MSTHVGRGGGGPAPLLDEARVGHFMHSPVVSCPASATLAEVAERMATQRIHCVVVPREHGGTSGPEGGWGVVSDIDLVGAAGARQTDLTAGGIAATPPVTVDRDEPLSRAAQLMSENAVAHLLVVAAGHDRPVGVISTLDIAGCISLAAGAR